MEIEIVIAIISLLSLSFLATVDMAFSRFSDVSLRRIVADAEEGKQQRAAALLREIIENRPRFRFAISSTIQVLLIVFTVFSTLLVARYTGDSRITLILFALIIGLASTVIFRQIIPRLLILSNPEKKLLFLLPVVGPLYSAATFLAGPFTRSWQAKEQQKLDSTVTPENADERADDNADDFQALMEIGEAEGIIEEKERELIEAMVDFNDTRAGEIMTPRTEICALPVEATIRAARDLIIEEKYSRIPVYRNSVDQIEGVIYVRDLLQAWADGKENESIQPLIRPAFFVPETKSASEMLKSMQQNHVQVAIVIDEYGGVAGLVTVEDVLEEIVGEIEDEDIEKEEIIEYIEGEGGYWDLPGSTEIGKIERIFDIEIEDDDFTTIAGLVTSEEGLVPKTGKKLNFRGLEVEILKADEKKIHKLRLRKEVTPAADGKEEEVE
jgi:CBS domain containing-hemolysin-like protein